MGLEQAGKSTEGKVMGVLHAMNSAFHSGSILESTRGSLKGSCSVPTNKDLTMLPVYFF